MDLEKFSGYIKAYPKCSRTRLYMISGSKKELYNSVILYIIRKVEILSLNRYGGKYFSKVFFSNRAIGIINFERLSPNFIADTMNWFLSSMLD